MVQGAAVQEDWKTSDGDSAERSPRHAALEEFLGTVTSHVLVDLAVDRGIAKMAPSVDDLLGGAAADSQLQSAAGDKICRARILNHVAGILIPHVDHSCTNFTPSRPGSD